MLLRVLALVALVGCTAPSPGGAPAHPGVELTGLGSPCDLAGWSPSDTGVCSKTLEIPLADLSHPIGIPVVAVDPHRPDRIAVVASAHARDVGYATSMAPVGPEHHWAPRLFLTQDGGRSWHQSEIPAIDLFFQTDPGGDPHASSPFAFFDQDSTLHVFASITGGGGPVDPAPSGVAHAMSADGSTWAGHAIVSDGRMRVAHAWPEGEHLYMLIDDGWHETPATAWSTAVDPVDWAAIDRYSCRLATEIDESMPRLDLGAWPGLPCPEERRLYAAEGVALEPVGDTGPVACSAAWLVPLEAGPFSLGNAGIGSCGAGKVLVGNGTATTLQAFFDRADDDVPPRVMGVTAGRHGDAVALASISTSVPERGMQPWLAAVDRAGSRIDLLPMVGAAEWHDDIHGFVALEFGGCGMERAGRALWVACAEHLQGDLRMFRLELDYA